MDKGMNNKINEVREKHAKLLKRFYEHGLSEDTRNNLYGVMEGIEYTLQTLGIKLNESK